jgi:hypothetical protein
MSTHKHIDLICVVVLILTVLLTILFMNGSRLGIETIIDEDAEANSQSVYFTANDSNGAWDTSSATRITLQGSTASVSGGGAYVLNGDVIISGAGWFVVSGTLDDGSIIVDANNTAKVWILLNGADITCSDGACLLVEQADKVFLTLAEGSTNSMTDGSVYSDANVEAGLNGAIFARDDLTINGSGSLTVTGTYHHGISAKDDLVITGGTVSVTAVGDAIHVNDSVRVKDASLTLSAEDDGIVVDEAEGYLYLESGDLTLDCADKGVSVVGQTLIAGGIVTIRSEDDCFNTDGAVTIAGGDFTLTSTDDGIHSADSITIAGGTILITECNEGIEAPTITVSGGDITVYPNDDGLNANGSFGFGGFGGLSGFGQTPAEESVTPSIHISGGTITVINRNARDADGIDSNGDIIISGGTILVSLVNGGTNSALDCGSESGGVMEISGGTVIACGSYSMAESFDSSSTQCSILYSLSKGADAGTTVSLEDTDGNVLLSWEVPCSFSSVNLSCPEMKVGETYLVVIGDKAEEITLEDVSSSFGDAQSSMFGGPMNWGGMENRENFGRPGGPPDGFDGERPDFGEMETPPDMSNFNGERPDMGGMTPPDMSDFSGKRPEMGEMGTPPGFPGSPSEAAIADATEAITNTAAATANDKAAAKDTSSITPMTLMIVIAVSISLLFGILIAAVYKPKI